MNDLSCLFLKMDLTLSPQLVSIITFKFFVGNVLHHPLLIVSTNGLCLDLVVDDAYEGRLKLCSCSHYSMVYWRIKLMVLASMYMSSFHPWPLEMWFDTIAFFIKMNRSIICNQLLRYNNECCVLLSIVIVIHSLTKQSFLNNNCVPCQS